MRCFPVKCVCKSHAAQESMNFSFSLLDGGDQRKHPPKGGWHREQRPHQQEKPPGYSKSQLKWSWGSPKNKYIKIKRHHASATRLKMCSDSKVSLAASAAWNSAAAFTAAVGWNTRQACSLPTPSRHTETPRQHFHSDLRLTCYEFRWGFVCLFILCFFTMDTKISTFDRTATPWYGPRLSGQKRLSPHLITRAWLLKPVKATADPALTSARRSLPLAHTNAYLGLFLNNSLILENKSFPCFPTPPLSVY